MSLIIKGKINNVSSPHKKFHRKLLLSNVQRKRAVFKFQFWIILVFIRKKMYWSKKLSVIFIFLLKQIFSLNLQRSRIWIFSYWLKPRYRHCHSQWFNRDFEWKIPKLFCSWQLWQIFEWTNASVADWRGEGLNLDPSF